MRIYFRESFVNVLSMLYVFLFFLWFVFQLVVCELQNSYADGSMFQIALFEYNRRNSQLNA